ncbi:hypothetical protein PVAG01_03094 [Phlyctema vagabunda]|uniref:Oxidoreductase-like protein n=1 Tax=Phlyctema vagabunda TaxID=108571 RepID=A0ABR4PSF0_9HELO
MAPHIEANSLSDIIHLASNPPKYPRNPTEEVRPSLTLYIARVPGSRDIILTTLKPQLKNVTAADVASSLYYLHLDTEDDARLLAEQETESEETAQATSPQRPLPRKPLPDSAKSSLDIQRVQLQPATSELITKYQGLPPDALPRDAPPTISNAIPRRPLAGRAPPSESGVARKPLPSLPTLDSQPLMNLAPGPTSLFSSRGLSPPRPTISTQSSFTSIYSTDGDKVAKEFTLTIIRRDPSSGGQWNIGKVVGKPVPPDPFEHRSRGSRSQQRKSIFNMSIHLSNPGYNWFRDPVTGSQSNQNTTSQSPIESPTGGGPVSGFNRQVQMERSTFWDRPLKQNRDSFDFAAARSHGHVRNSSEESNNPADLENSEFNNRANGYVFTSIWGGRCTFSTGGGGRNLRCKHTLPERHSTSNAVAGSAQMSAAVSELRFNLPTTVLFKNATSALAEDEKAKLFKAKLGHIRNKLSTTSRPPPPLPPRPQPQPTSYAALYPSDEDGETREEIDDKEDRLDLSMGQEKAGGGSRGKRAKLGKLIIHDEGLKMLDLVIAANMSVWWSIWEPGHS